MGSALLKSIFSDYPKSLTSRIHEVCVFSVGYHNSYILLNNINFIYTPFVLLQSHLLCVGMVSVTSASRYQSRFSMYIRGLIPRNSTELVEAVPKASIPCNASWKRLTGRCYILVTSATGVGKC